jgi:hypothetical protein
VPVTVTHRGTEYPCPLSERFRRHEPHELEAMAASIREHGVLNAVLTFSNADELGAKSVLDGEGRLTAAAMADADVPMIDLGYMSVEKAYSIALGLNDARRHDKPGAISQRRRERVALVRGLRGEKGLSLDDIAERIGVSVAQVRRDLEAGGGDPKAKEKPDAPDPEPATPDFDIPDDDGPRFDLAQQLGSEVLKLTHSLAGGKSGRHLRRARLPGGEPLLGAATVGGKDVLVPLALVDVLRAVRQARPGEVCPCGGEDAKCKACRGAGYAPADPAVLAYPPVTPAELPAGGEVSDVWGAQ